jgi:hypothetical protein
MFVSGGKSKPPFEVRAKRLERAFNLGVRIPDGSKGKLNTE